MNILAIETTSSIASVAVMNEKKECVEVISNGPLTHLQRLIPLMDEALTIGGLELKDITGLAVSRGPGSFTGIRIGVATAKALAQVLGVKIAQVPTLFAMSHGSLDRDGLICPILDARRNQIYSAGYVFENGEPKEIFPEGAYDPEELLEFLAPFSQVHFMGDGVGSFQPFFEENLKNHTNFLCGEERMQRASLIAKIGYQMHLEGKVVDYITAEPEYLRKSEAERNLEKKQNNNGSV